MRGDAVIVRSIAATGLAVLLAACAPSISPSPERPPPPSLSEHIYHAAAARGEPVYRVDTQRSLVVVKVRRGGSLARFGHDHVVASRELYGFVWFARENAARRADLYLPLDSLTVDEPALRAEAGFETTPSASDVAGTRQNMLYKVLQVDHHPYVVLRITSAAETATGLALTGELALHGVTRPLHLPVSIDTAGQELRITGAFTLRQTAHDITPYAILGGALRVEDPLELRFEIICRPMGAGAKSGDASIQISAGWSRPFSAA